MKKLLSVSIALLMLFVLLPQAFAAGDGTVVIWSVQDLDKVNENPSGSFILARDIDLSGIESFEPLCSEAAPFTGTFDGNGHSVKNLRIRSTFDCMQGDTPCNAAFFDVVSDGTIKNLRMENVSIVISVSGYTISKVAYSQASGVAGLLTAGGVIENCTVTGDIRALAGYNCYVRTSGIACTDGAFIRNCKTDAYVLGAAEYTNTMVGGIAAWDDGTVIENCCTKGTLFSHNSNGMNYVGGISGSGGGIIRNCAALVGSIGTVGSISNSGYNTTDVIGAFSTVQNCMAGKSLSETAPNKGAYILSDALASSELIYQNLGWDMNDVWMMTDGAPALRHNSTTEFITETDGVITVSFGDTVMRSYEGILEIGGTGAVAAPGGAETTPLNEFSSADVIIIDESVPFIAENAFARFEDASIVIIKGNTAVSPSAFSGLENIPVIYLGGSPVIDSAFPDSARADVFVKEGSYITGELPAGFNVHTLSQKDGKVNISGTLDIDAYKFFDLCTLICSEYDGVETICMDKFICNNLQFFRYDAESGFTEPIWDHTLTHAEVSVKIPDGDNRVAISWNEFCELGLAGDVDSFCLTVTADEYPEIEDAEIKIEDENDPPSIFQRILKFFTSLINKIFSLFSKLK